MQVLADTSSLGTRPALQPLWWSKAHAHDTACKGRFDAQQSKTLSRGIPVGRVQLKSLQDRGVCFAIKKGHNALQAPPVDCPDYIYPGPNQASLPRACCRKRWLAS